MHTIRDVAAHFNITYDALRFYEKKGLLKGIRRNANGQREYSEQDIDDLKKILRLRQLGATIEEIKHISALLNPDNQTIAAYDESIALLNRLKTETTNKISQLQQQQVYLDHKVALFEHNRDNLGTSRANVNEN